MRQSDLIVRPWYALFMGRKLPVAVGRGGIGEKRGEGDGITPIGEWIVEEWLIRPDRVHGAAQAIRPFDRWCDESDHALYNQLFSKTLPISSERMFRSDALYDVVGIVDYNRAPIVAGNGSAIFIHQWRRARFPTEGCVAFSRKDLHWIAANWNESSRLIVQP